MIKSLALAIEEGNFNMFIGNFEEAQKVGLHKELDMMKLDFAQKRISQFHVYDEAFQFKPSHGMQALLIEAKNMDLKEEKIKVSDVDHMITLMHIHFICHFLAQFICFNS